MLSTLAGAEAAEGADVVLVHDAARPFVSATLVREVLDATRRHGAAVPALPARETVKRADADGFIAETVDRTSLRLAQTPQGARRDWLIEALRQAVADGVDVTDEAQALERAGRRVALVDGDPRNVKLTTSADWDTAPRVDPREAGWRVGTGFDIHRFAPGRSLKLGGVEFDGEIGLAGHSDADVVLHAAMDAVLGAAGRPDIGQIFPPDDPAFAGADSTMLARRVAALVLEDGWRVVNIDLTVLAERPKILPRSGAMKAAVGACFEVPASCVGIKATTLEGLGALGRAEGIACQAIVMLGRTVPYR
jgi:2-C-methyl-D-erythritol 4-phosphate cytidylyltransferase/2-C-methyl-D-erythritol 2,4-cyclodiphosphate synthase